ncbi:chromogranin-A [Melanotaenia boesemani]|uniref:chromogranin-A n=1 Tax=Melanotaenia boesemani TaxID=1250792 RepID=UPI001C048873|nr:chromogranin-A [Melanotaenia boesemani]
MIGRGLFLLTVLFSCVLSLPVTSSQLENVDAEVMKCIVEALADVLSRPQLMPVSQECLITLKTDDRLVAILRHHNFLKELQDIAVQGDQERAKLQGNADVPAPKTQAIQTTDDSGDRSMLEALGSPGERSILSQRKRTENEDGREEKDESREDGGSQEDSEAVEVQVKRGKEEDQGEAEKREEDADKEEHNEKRASLEEVSKEKKTMDKKGDEFNEERDASRNKSKQKKSEEENEEEKNKRSSLFSHMDKEEEKEEEGKSGSRESVKQWTKRAKFLHLKKKADGKEAQQLPIQHEVPHHSKEVMVEEMEEEKKKRRGIQKSPEEKELQMIARRAPEERRGMEEEGSASRKSEEPEIESLAAIESELENVAQKLHELRRG